MTITPFSSFVFLIVGVFCCGPAPVKAIKDRRIDLFYDIPFVYAEVNADVHTIVVSQGRVVSHNKDTERVGSLICTKAVGLPRHENITRDYKYIKSMSQTQRVRSESGLTFPLKLLCSHLSFYFYITGPTSTLTSRSSAVSDDSTTRRGNFEFLIH